MGAEIAVLMGRGEQDDDDSSMVGPEVRAVKALDLFCGAGGASMGLHLAGFEVTGVDIKKQPRYPFRFVQADALNPPFSLSEFDLIWASPPCQAYSAGNAGARAAGNITANSHPDLVAPIRQLLEECDALTVIENVPGAPVRADLVLDGTMFVGLRVLKKRLFELNFPAPFALGFDCSGMIERGKWVGLRLQGRHQRSPVYDLVKKQHLAENMRDAHGAPWIIGKQALANAIPPAYAEFIGREAMRFL
jgi:DNA (cytosine-5)-methyltransferase 1